MGERFASPIGLHHFPAALQDDVATYAAQAYERGCEDTWADALAVAELDAQDPDGRLAADRAIATMLLELPHGLSDGRKRTAHGVAASLLNDFTMSPVDVWELLEAWNADNRPPLDAATLGGIIESARTVEQRRAA